MVDFNLKKGDKVYFDEVGTGRRKATFVRFDGMDAVVKPLYKNKNKKVSNTVVRRRK